MKIINKLSAVILGMSLLLGSGMALADATQEEAANEANARGIEKSDIKRGMKVEKKKSVEDDATKRAGDPIPDIDITLDQAQSVCQAGSGDCDDGSTPVEPGASQKGATKFKAGKALAETVKKVDKGDDVKHIDADSDDDGLPEQ